MRFSPFYPLPRNLVCQSFLNVEASEIINYIFMKTLRLITYKHTKFFV